MVFFSYWDITSWLFENFVNQYVLYENRDDQSGYSYTLIQQLIMMENVEYEKKYDLYVRMET